ncbi:hypothetical protein SSX86_026416 [Deinandra increscens subsp. villosa]|uniref:Uncharacterized protein n=1 Tax=Deinandra increscens subsp. villosa TaxID=3103831 RepID=A0AAP0GM75_9ASTR
MSQNTTFAKMETNTRPNRSDAHLSKQEEAKIEGETRDYFDGLAPKRHTKPQRSEYAAQYVDGLRLPGDQDDGVTPEYAQFQNLEKSSEKLVYGGNEASDEFVETEYYKDLNGVDKQHHTNAHKKGAGTTRNGRDSQGRSGTKVFEPRLLEPHDAVAKQFMTGTGFIKVDGRNETAFNLGPESEHAHHASSKGNPATNEWTPQPVDMASLVSNKPPRSDN